MVLVVHWNWSALRATLSVATCLCGLFIFLHYFEGRFHIPGCDDDPIDVVYTWVNGSDPKFIDKLHAYLHRSSIKGGTRDSSIQRYDSKDELLYSLRSLEQNAPWIRHVYIVTNGQVPTWLNMDSGKVTVVTHKEIYPHSFDLPTFSSPSIETHLHRIPGLSKRFIYMNDDMFLRSPIYKDDFVSQSGSYSIYLAWIVPMCFKGCSWFYVADGHCDDVCNNPSCQMDGGDCGDHDAEGKLGDVIVQFEDYVVPHFENKPIQVTNYSKILAHLKNSTGIKLMVDNRNGANNSEEEVVQRLIDDHNRKVMHLDKLRRKKFRKRREMENEIKRMRTQYSVDAYSASLQYTNRLLNKKYGFSVRKVPAHAPIMIDRDIMDELQKKFEKEVRLTSSNRIRSTDDLQYSFSYYYFLIHEKVHKTIGEIFDMFDTNHSRSWTQAEARLALTKIHKLPLTDNVLDTFNALLVKCLGGNELDHLPHDFLITKELLTTCPILTAMFLKVFGVQHKYNFTLVQDSEKTHVAFKMLTSNLTDVTLKFDEIRKTNKKFVCINDNLDYDSPIENTKVLAALYDLYESLFPNPSMYELERGLRNQYQYLHEHGQHRWLYHVGRFCLLLVAAGGIWTLWMRPCGIYKTICRYCKCLLGRRGRRGGRLANRDDYQNVA